MSLLYVSVLCRLEKIMSRCQQRALCLAVDDLCLPGHLCLRSNNPIQETGITGITMFCMTMSQDLAYRYASGCEEVVTEAVEVHEDSRNLICSCGIEHTHTASLGPSANGPSKVQGG